jgi:hypothetical protein
MVKLSEFDQKLGYTRMHNPLFFSAFRFMARGRKSAQFGLS